MRYHEEIIEHQRWQRAIWCVWACLLVVFTSLHVQAQDFVTNVSNKGTVAASFLEIGVGARAEAMGGAYAAEAGRPEMIYWNPAGLAYLNGVATSFTHTEWLADTQFDFFTLATPLPFFNSVFAASFTTLGVPEQAVRTVEAPEGTGEFYDARDMAVNFAVASRIISTFSVGITGKYISQRIWSERASQIALDVGVYYQTPFQGLAIGASISNFGPDMSLAGKNLNDVIDPDLFNRGIENIPVEYKTDSSPLPQIFRFGVTYDTPLPGSGNVVTSVSLLHPTGSTESVNFGIEYGFNDLIFFRGGYQSLYERDSISGLTLGGGLQYILKNRNTLVFDYAWSDWGILRNAHRISLGIHL